MRTTVFIPAFIPAFVFGLTTSFSQEGVLDGETTYRAPGGAYAATVPMTSLTFQMPPEAKTYKMNDLIQVRVFDEQVYANTVNNQRKKSITSTSRLTDFLTFKGVFGMPGRMDPEDLPAIGGEINVKYQNNANMNRNESYKTIVMCRVKNVHENGTLYIEGSNKRRIGEESSMIFVGGTVRPEDIDANGGVDSKFLNDYDIKEVPDGNVFDMVRRPWGTRWLEHWFPF